MTKFLSLGLVLLTSFVLVGCQFRATNDQPSPSPTPTAVSTTEASPTTQPGGRNLSDIAAAVMQGGSYNCAFADPETKQQMSYLIQGKKVSMTMNGTTQNSAMSRMISDGTNVYIWDPTTKKGMKIPSVTPEELQAMAQQTGQNPNVPDFSDPAELEKLQQQYQVDCQPSIINVNEFQVPTEVEFQDMSQMMEMMKKYQVPR